MKEFIELLTNIRFWTAFLGFAFPFIGCGIAGAYILIKESINERIQNTKR